MQLEMQHEAIARYEVLCQAEGINQRRGGSFMLARDASDMSDNDKAVQ